MSLSKIFGAMVIAQASANAVAAVDEVEVIQVKAQPNLLRSDLDSLISSTLIEKDQLMLLQSSSLGETLKMTPGIHASYFGPSSSSPIIRGLDGPRIRIMQNGLDGGDASRISPDHQVTAETSSATEIEILRGPATLLHGSGAIGGVINVVDQRVPSKLNGGTSGEVQTSFNSGDDEKSVSGRLQTDIGNNVSVYLDGFSRDAHETELPSGSEHKTIENSQAESHGFTVGAAYIGKDSRIGFSYGELDSKYGLVGHEEHHHEDEHEEEGHHDEDEHHEEEEHGHEEMPFVKATQKRYQLQGNWFDVAPSISEISLKMAHTDYQLREIEGEETATQIDNDSSEVKLQLHHNWLDSWQGIVGVHWHTSDMTPIGEEATTVPTTSDTLALYTTAQRQWQDLTWHVGARVEHVKITPQLEQANAVDSVSFTPVSWSGGVNWQVNKQHQVLVNLNHSQRALSAGELFAFGEHLGTSTFDVGAYFSMASENGEALFRPAAEFNALETEDATTLDIGWQYSGEDVAVATSLFYSDVSNFAYQDFVDLSGGDLPIYQYRQDDVTIAGGELQVNYFASDTITLSSFVDYSRVKLKSGGNAPRIPPLRVGMELEYANDGWHASANASYYTKQSKTAINETTTDGYTLVGMSLSHDQQFNDSALKLYLKVNNVLDEKAKVHSSFVKDDAPLPGLSAKVGMRWTF